MKLYGIGTDIVKISRIKKSIQNRNFLNRIFSKDEIYKCNKLSNKSNCYAKRFAGKEAFSKALGTGISNGIAFNEILVLNEKNGKPFFKIIGETKKIVIKRLKRKKFKISLSLSYEKKYAVAFVTISI